MSGDGLPVQPPAILERLQGVLRRGNGWTALCPAHEDRRRSLSISLGDDGRTLLHCFADCTPAAICAAVNLTLADLFVTNGHGGVSKGGSAAPALAPATPSPGGRRVVKAYDYEDESGKLLYQVVRFEPKDFRPRRPIVTGGWSWSLENTRRVVYNLPGLAEARRAFLVEGEEDADNLCARGLRATTTPGGAASWRDEYAKQIADAGVEEVVILPDNDEPGGRYAAKAAAALTARGLQVHIVRLPGLAAKGDVSDWLAAGHEVGELEALIAASGIYSVESGAVEPPVAASDYIESLAAFLAESDPPVDYIIPELLPVGVVMLMHGEPRARKSLAALELALAAATGTPAFGLSRLTPPEAVTVLYVQEEDPRSLTRPRLRALVRDRCGAVCPDTLHVAVRRGVSLDDPAWVERIIVDLQRLGARLLVLDAARRLSALTDEGPSKVRELVAVLRRIVATTGVSIAIVHHDVKPPANGQDQRRRSQRASGGDWFAAAECPVHIERIGARESLVYPEDYKFSGDPAPFTFTCEIDGELITRLVGTDTTTESAARAGVRGKVVDWLRVNGPAAKRAMQQAGLGRWETIAPVVDALCKEGLCDSAPGRQRGSLRYFLVSAPGAAEHSTGPTGASAR